jgi:hypothetical protein
MSTHDIIFIQEHWLHTFEIEQTVDRLQKAGFNSKFKAFDSDNPVDHSVRTRGKSGVGVLWKKSLDLFEPLIEEGGDRIMCGVLHSASPILFVSVYMPSDGVNSPDDYQATLNQLEEILTKYEQRQIVLVGDLNASLHRNLKRRFDNLLKCFLDRQGIEMPENYPSHPTFSLYRTRCTTKGCSGGKEVVESLIDYVLCRPTHIVQRVVVLDEADGDIFTCNGSDHHPVSAAMSYRPPGKSKDRDKRKSRKPVQIMQWDKIDTDLYRSTVSEHLKTLDVQKNTAEENLDALTSALLTASAQAVPTRKWYPNRKKTLPRDTLELHRKSKQLFWIWKTNGRNRDDPIYDEMQRLKKEIRCTQRRELAQSRNNYYQDIAANKNNAKIFHGLVNRQRKHATVETSKLVVNGEEKEDDEEITEAWAQYFENLSTPSNNENFDEDHLQFVQHETSYLRDTIAECALDMTEITALEVLGAIKRLHNNKAPDLWGIKAEHIKLAADETLPTITTAFNQIVRDKRIPGMFKKGFLTPVLKKGKSKTDPSGYRGIVVCSILGKLLEIVLIERLALYFDPRQSELQCGFSKNTSYLHAALITQEAICDSLENKNPVTQILLDAEKAFDVVWHDGLLQKMYSLGIPKSLWLLFSEWYDGLTAVVKWKGALSSEFPLRQGTGQGRTFSTTNYKIFNNDLLLRIENAGLGIHIGDIHVGSPTCADDVTLLANSNSTDPQTMTSCVELYANENRYTIGMSKTQMVMYNPTNKRGTDNLVTYNGEPISHTETATQLGVLQGSSKKMNSQRINSNVEVARRTAYTLFGSGFHGTNGMNPSNSKVIWELHILPRLIHGLEICKVSEKDLAPAEVFCRKICKQLLGIPQNSPTPAVYLMFGVLPIEAEVHRRVLRLFRDIAARPATREYNVALRQLAQKDTTSGSWFIFVQTILTKYNLRSAHEILANPPSKLSWKRLVKMSITLHWETKLREEALAYRSLGYLSLTSMRGACTPLIWSSSAHSVYETAKAAIKCKLLTGTYPLQTTHRKFNQFEVDATCLLCKEEDETTKHFVATCSELKAIRDRHIPRLSKILQADKETTHDISDPAILTQMLLDCSGLMSVHNSPAVVDETEKISRDYLYAIHKERHSRLHTGKWDTIATRLPDFAARQ